MYIDEALLIDEYGSDQVAAYCPDAGSLARAIENAEAETESVLQSAGYGALTPSSNYTSTNEVPKIIKAAAAAAWLKQVLAANVIEPNELQRDRFAILAEIRDGAMTIAGIAPSAAQAVGGVQFTESSDAVSVEDGSRPQVFNRKTMTGW